MTYSRSISHAESPEFIQSSDNVDVEPPMVVLPSQPEPSHADGHPRMVLTQCPECGRMIGIVGIQRLLSYQAFQPRFAESQEMVIFEGSRASVYTLRQWGWVMLTLGIAYLLYWYQNHSTRYTITTQRIIIREGVFSVTEDTIELLEIEDFSLSYPWGMKCLGYGVLKIRSSKRGYSSLSLYGIKNIKGIYEDLRHHVIQAEKRRSTSFLERTGL